MTDNPHELVRELGDHDAATGVRAGPNRITVVHAPEEDHVEAVPSDLVTHIESVIEDTIWQAEYDGTVDGVERHSWSGGVHHSPVLSGGSQPAGYELQYHLVR